MKKVLDWLLIVVFLVGSAAAVIAQKEETSFKDIPKGNYFEAYIYKLRELNITNGVGNGAFGFNQNITRAEFLTFLLRLQKVELNNLNNSNMFHDVQVSDWHYSYINTGLNKGIILGQDYINNKFEPNKPITREEMAVMIVRALGYDALAIQVDNQPTQFKDVTKRIGYIEVAKDMGIINGRSKDSFAPAANALRQEAAAMLVRMYDLINNKLDNVHGFYAIKAFNQLNKTSSFDSIGYGWSKLDINQASGLVELTTVKDLEGHPFYIPDDYQVPLAEADKNNVAKYLMVFASNEDLVTLNNQSYNIVSLLLSSEEAKQKLVTDIINKLDNINGDGSTETFEGVVIDFEALRDQGTDKQSFIEFLTLLNKELDAKGKALMVCVNPPRQAGQSYYNGYDFAAIGQMADYVVLMAHDYDAKKLAPAEMEYFKGATPLAPINDVYYAIKYTLDNGLGVPKNKLLLQISFGATQWQFRDNKPLNNQPYNPDYSKLVGRMIDPNTTVKDINYSDKYQSPYFEYENEGIQNIIWYEDERSVAAKTKLAQMFGLGGVSFWRMGIIPDFAAAEQAGTALNVWKLIDELKND